MSGSLAGQAALVTGASRGLGRLVALALSAEGARVGLLARDANALNDVAVACAAAGAEATSVITADVTDPDAVPMAVEAVRQALGPLDLLVNNAGLVDPVEAEPWRADPGAWWRVVEANLRGPFLVTHAALPEMVERGRGRVVNVNSGMALRPAPAYSAYSVSKAALARLTDNLAAALAGTGVSVFDVSPGAVPTDMTASMPMHAGRTRWTDPRRFTDLVVAVATGELDALSGWFLHAGQDEPATLRGLAGPDLRRLRLRPYGPRDPLG